MQRLRKAHAVLALAAVLSVAACSAHQTPVVPAVGHSTHGGAAASSQTSENFATTAALKHLTDRGQANPAAQVHLFISLAHRNQQKLDQLIKDQATPGSADYEKFLTPQQFDEQFGALPETREKIKNALHAAGFTVKPDRFGASVIEADGPVTAANAYFSVHLHEVDDHGRPALLPDAVPTLPVEMQGTVVSVLGLDTTHLIGVDDNAAPARSISPALICPQTTTTVCCSPDCPSPSPRPTYTPGPTPAPTPVPGSQYALNGPGQPLSPPAGYYDDTTFYPTNGLQGYAPYTYAKDFDMPVQHGFAGSAQFAVGVLADSDVSDNDLQQFYSYMGVHRTGGLFRMGSTNTSDFEATLDVEAVSAFAPAANIYLYRVNQWSDPAVVAAGMNQAVSDNFVSVLSISYAACEKQPWPSYYEVASAEDNAAAQGSAQGITVVAGTGDNGGPSYLSGCPSINAPASSSYVTAVGGTSPYGANLGSVPANAYRWNPYGDGYQYAWAENVQGAKYPPCSNSGLCATNGGASTHFQTPEQLDGQACGGLWRCTPDISLAADSYWPGFVVWNGRAGAFANGTSFAAPMFAAIQAEIDQRQGTRKGNIVGRLFTTWATYGYGAYASGQNPVFHDVTAGNTGWQATSGYDAASGIGWIDGFSLSSVE